MQFSIENIRQVFEFFSSKLYQFGRLNLSSICLNWACTQRETQKHGNFSIFFSQIRSTLSAFTHSTLFHTCCIHFFRLRRFVFLYKYTALWTRWRIILPTLKTVHWASLYALMASHLFYQSDFYSHRSKNKENSRLFFLSKYYCLDDFINLPIFGCPKKCNPIIFVGKRLKWTIHTNLWIVVSFEIWYWILCHGQNDKNSIRFPPIWVFASMTIIMEWTSFLAVHNYGRDSCEAHRSKRKHFVLDIQLHEVW